jgi:hypothetical protein
MKNEVLKMMFFRAVENTRNLDTANLIVGGDFLTGDTMHEKIEDAMRIYDLKMSECFRILAFLQKQTKYI